MTTLKEAKTTAIAFEILGGDEAVADMAETNAKAVTNWRYFNEFPARVAIRIQSELNRRGYYIRWELLGQVACSNLGAARLSK